MDNKEMVPHIVANAKINITLGTAIINNIQMTYGWLLEGKSKEDADKLKAKLENKEPLDGWSLAVVTITDLIRQIHQTAKDSGMVEYKTLEDTLKPLVQ